jgi:hypothetical protein
VGLFFILKLISNIFLIKKFGTFFYFLKREKGTELFKNLLRGKGVRLISLFWEKKMEDGSGVGFFYFHLCNFLGSFTLQKRGGRVGVWGFFIRLITSPY